MCCCNVFGSLSLQVEFAPSDVLAISVAVGLSTANLIHPTYTLNNTMACLIASDILQLVRSSMRLIELYNDTQHLQCTHIVTAVNNMVCLIAPGMLYVWCVHHLVSSTGLNCCQGAAVLP